VALNEILGILLNATHLVRELSGDLEDIKKKLKEHPEFDDSASTAEWDTTNESLKPEHK
jgi:hypothetical protein